MENSKRPVIIISSIVALCVVFFVANWLFNQEPPIDRKAGHDFDVKAWLKEYDSEPAVAFLEGGGVIADMEEEGEFDQPYLLPLLKSLEDKYSLEFINISIDGEHYALVASLPKDLEIRNAIRNDINDTNEKIPGLISHHWGHKWLKINAFYGGEFELLQEAGAIEEIKKKDLLPPEE